MHKLSPLKSGSTANNLPYCYKQWAHSVSVCGGGCFQVSTVRDVDGLTPKEIRDALTEVLARATFEVVFGIHFDGISSDVDMFVVSQILELFGDHVLRNVCGGLLLRSENLAHIERLIVWSEGGK